MMEKNDKSNGNIGETEEQSTLFTASSSITENAKKRKKKRSLKKQALAIAIAAAVTAGAICAYFFVVAPMIERQQEELAKQNETKPIELLEGEVLATGNKVLMYEHFERADIGKIHVHNEYGDYGYYYNETDESFYVVDHETAPFDATAFSTLVVAVGKTTADRPIDHCEDFSQYGLAPDQDPAWFEMTTRSGETHKVYVGYQDHTGTGYYAKYEGRDALYIIGSSSGGAIKASLASMITPLLSLPMAQNDYFMLNNFAITKDGEPVIIIDYLTPEEKEAEAATNAYKMLFPAKYEVHSTGYSDVLYSLVEFKGATTLVYTPTDEELEKYGLSTPKYSIYYEYKELEQFIVISEKNENGNYYAYSALFDLITEIDGATYGWIEWDLVKWVDEPIFMMNIKDVAHITVASDTATRIFDIVPEDNDVAITERGGFKPEKMIFKNFYKSLLSIYMQGYAIGDITEAEAKELRDNEKPYLTLTVETHSGRVTEYKFYPYSTRRAYYTVNGSGQFYVLRDMVTKIISDAEKVMTNTPVDSTAHS